jgi:hypothetical protein
MAGEQPFVAGAARRRNLSVALALATWVSASGAMSQTIAIVGTGTASCSRFTSAIADRPLEEREFFAWGQGYMSGILFTAPAGVDDGLSLTPESFPIPAQIAFVRAFCDQFPTATYSEGVETLYRALGGKAVK